jgi:hypothetical protein
MNQSSIRADVYNGLADALSSADCDLNNIGKNFILPSSYTGGPRFFASLRQIRLVESLVLVI